MPLPLVAGGSLADRSGGPARLPPAPPSGNTSWGSRQAATAARLKDAWNPYLRETTLRLFASAGVSAQIGRFTQPLLDYTAMSARLDMGLTAPYTG